MKRKCEARMDDLECVNDEQESVARGYLQSCFGSEFVCGKLAARSPIQDWLAEVFQAISREYKQPIGAVPEERVYIP
ncbi:MAG TPA: hypothetical protein VJT80_00365 [Steroidobacteraceae bacterium]|nr:hypothetical protein [Steroidobacteraceae bacterium]